jgi:hypothetical protein
MVHGVSYSKPIEGMGIEHDDYVRELFVTWFNKINYNRGLLAVMEM